LRGLAPFCLVPQRARQVCPGQDRNLLSFSVCAPVLTLLFLFGIHSCSPRHRCRTWQWKWRDVPCAAITAARPHALGVLVHCFIHELLPDVYSLDLMRRWAAGHLSDAPELTPLVPLGDFVTQPGKPPSEEVAHNCVSTLRIGRGS